MTRPALELRPGQHLVLTPQLQQSIRLLQLSTLELEQEIAQALEQNPLLEREDEGGLTSAETPASEANTDVANEQQDQQELDVPDSFDSYSSNGGDDDRDLPEAARSETLREHLLGQLMLTRATDRDLALVGLLIDELDENGFLASPLEEILTWLPTELEIELEELQTALSLLQSFDPAGVGAADLPQCLILQLRRADITRLPEASDARVVACARQLCADHLAALASGNFGRLRDVLQCDDTLLKAAHALIRRLDPRPGRAWTVPAADYAIPDILVRQTSRGWQALLNPAAMPRLRVNSVYAQVLSGQRDAPYAVLQSQLQQARWMVRNVEQRFDTILRVGQAIVAHQKAFFTQGPAGMRPLILKDLASELDLHESTISRATTRKYMLTPFGTLELKRFFGAGVTNDQGETSSATAVQARIRQMVIDENRAKPLSDSQITRKLADQGIVIARRTVAKYRESLRIAPAALRKAQAQR